MNPTRLLFRTALGRRLPVTEGVITVDGLQRSVEIGRDRFGVPHIRASTPEDAYYGLGFAQGQDRAFQIEGLQRVGRGTLAALIGADGINTDRLSRRIGFAAAGREHLDLLDDEDRRGVEAFAAGITAGRIIGLPRRPHEYVLLRAHPGEFTAADVMAIFTVLAFGLASNWDAELARLEILTKDGPDALRDLDTPYAEWHSVSEAPGEHAGVAADRLREDLETFLATVGVGGASNNWALAGSRTASGRPILANDPHLAPGLPPHWYLAHLTAPDLNVVGAAFTGTPGFGAGHNGHVAWGVTAGMIDNTDLFLEEVGRDPVSVRRGDEFVPCEVRTEVIEVRGASAVTEEVWVTPHGPIVGPALVHSPSAISMAATWLKPTSITLGAGLPHVTDVDALGDQLEDWHGFSLNFVAADTNGDTAWYLTGQAPRRLRGHGMLPAAGWDPANGWEEDPVPWEEMPSARSPEIGYLATANNKPRRGDDGPFLGADWLDGHRITRINQILPSRGDWDIPSVLHTQLDRVTPQWGELRSHVLDIGERSGSVTAFRLLREWDGDMGAHSAAATVFVTWLAEMERRVVAARAPNATEAALGRGYTRRPFPIYSLFAFRRGSHLTRLLEARPDGWFDEWTDEVARALAAAEATLRERFGDDPVAWAWGTVRPLVLRHPLSARKPLDRVFDLGPIPWGGDFSTIAQSGAPPLDTFGDPSAIPSLRMAIDVGDWNRSRYSLPGGQSGNPLSPHYGDQLPYWRDGIGITIAFSGPAVERAIVEHLFLSPPEA